MNFFLSESQDFAVIKCRCGNAMAFEQGAVYKNMKDEDG